MNTNVLPVALTLCVSTALMARALSATPEQTTSMPQASEATYTGCLERGSSSGAFLLTHADRVGGGSMTPESMSSGMMPADSMTKESMSKSGTDSMKASPGDAMKDDGMKHDAMMHAGMMATVAVTSRSVNLSRYVGQKVSVKGSSATAPGGSMATTALSVKSLTVVAKSCS